MSTADDWNKEWLEQYGRTESIRRALQAELDRTLTPHVIELLRTSEPQNVPPSEVPPQTRGQSGGKSE